MKRIPIVVLALVLLSLALVACGGGGSGSEVEVTRIVEVTVEVPTGDGGGTVVSGGNTLKTVQDRGVLNCGVPLGHPPASVLLKQMVVLLALTMIL